MQTDKELQDIIAAQFREQEIQRREARKKIVANYLKLDSDLSPEEKQLVKRYKGNIFQRVWQAIWNN